MKTCDGCGKTILKKGVAIGGDNYCDICYKKYYEKCTECNTIYAKVCMYPINEGYICGNCLKSSASQYSICSVCNTLHDVSSNMIMTITTSTPNHKRKIICKLIAFQIVKKLEILKALTVVDAIKRTITKSTKEIFLTSLFSFFIAIKSLN